MMGKIYFSIPVYNEEKNLSKFIRSLSESTKFLKNFKETFFCLNGCKDNSEKIIKENIKKFPHLNIKLLKSKKGKINAQKEIILHQKEGHPIFFLDADTKLKKNSIKIILKELNENKELIAVGGFPIAKKYSGKNLWKRFLDNILNIKSRHPMSEISKLNVEKYHALAISHPQNLNTRKEHELKSKIFFHGRIFCLRSKKYWDYPKKKGIVGDDSYLPDYITYNYGKNKIRIRYDALTYYQPFLSLKKHYITYKRVYFDLKNLKKKYPKFKEIREHSALKLDWRYINSLKYSEKIKFYIFTLIRFFEKKIFELSLNKNPKKIWN